MQSCTRLSQSCAIHFRPISFGISPSAASNASNASSGELKRTPKILSVTLENKKITRRQIWRIRRRGKQANGAEMLVSKHIQMHIQHALTDFKCGMCD